MVVFRPLVLIATCVLSKPCETSRARAFMTHHRRHAEASEDGADYGQDTACPRVAWCVSRAERKSVATRARAATARATRPGAHEYVKCAECGMQRQRRVCDVSRPCKVLWSCELCTVQL